jgi:hypothetical protein
MVHRIKDHGEVQEKEEADQGTSGMGKEECTATNG